MVTFSTPQPRYESSSVIPTAAPGKLSESDKSRLRGAAFRARQVYPGPVGEFLHYEITAWADFGFRFGDRGQMAALVAHVLAADIAKAA